MTFYIIIAFSTFFISLIGTKLVILTLRKTSPSPDIKILTGKQKPPPTPNGGIAVVFALIIGFLAVEANYAIILAMFLLTGLPLLASITPIPDAAKPIIRLIAIMILLGTFSGTVFTDILPPLLDKFLAALLWLWIIHSFDKLDVVEGLLSIEMISIGVGLYALTILSEAFFSSLSIESLIFATTGFGFLWWSHHPAKVLAGEIANIPVGFIAGYLLLLAANNGYIISALILPAYFLADSFITFFNRPFSERFGERRGTKDSFPCCLIAIKNSQNPAWVVRLITGTNMLLVFISIQTLLNPHMAIFNLVIAYIMVFTLIWFFVRKTDKRSL